MGILALLPRQRDGLLRQGHKKSGNRGTNYRYRRFGSLYRAEALDADRVPQIRVRDPSWGPDRCAAGSSHRDADAGRLTVGLGADRGAG